MGDEYDNDNDFEDDYQEVDEPEEMEEIDEGEGGASWRFFLNNFLETFVATCM
jgi:hypothetical protein